MNSAALIRSISIAQETCVTYIAVCVDDIDVLGQEHEEGAHRYCSFNEFLVVLICIASLLTEGGT